MYASFGCLLAASADAGATDLADRVLELTRGSAWLMTGETPIQFRTFHTQGMVKVGDDFFVSSVEIIKPTTKYDHPKDGYDRDTGEGRGHLFKISADGKLLADVIVGEGSIYHPGGIDFDGQYIWVPVAEYRPGGASIIYKVDPNTLLAERVFGYPDHITSIIHDVQEDMLVGTNWGSTWIFPWKMDDSGKVLNADVDPEKLRVRNPSQYFDFQDCKSAGAARMLCTGRLNADPYRLGGVELMSLTDFRPIWQAPIDLMAPTKRTMAINPAYFEATATGLRAWFMPDDDQSILYTYEVDLPGQSQ